MKSQPMYSTKQYNENTAHLLHKTSKRLFYAAYQMWLFARLF